MNEMMADLLRGMDPAAIARDMGLVLDPWQRTLVTSTAPQIAVCLPRQHGKSAGACIKALSIARSEPGSLSLILAPSQRQSNELILQAKRLYRQIKDAPALAGDNVQRIELANGSRILGLPGGDDAGATLRGLAHVRLIIADEAAYVSDSLIAAVRPFLSTNRRGQLILLSTPNSTTGTFYEVWHRTDDAWQRIQVPLGSCPRITPEFIELQRREMGETDFARDYLCRFLDASAAAFDTSLIEAMFQNDLEPITW